MSTDIEQYREVATPIVLQGFSEGLSDDELKLRLFTAKVPYSLLNSVVRTIAVEEGLRVDPKQVLNDVKEALAAYVDWEGIDDYDDLWTLAESIENQVKGSNVTRIIELARNHCQPLGIVLPARPRSAKKKSREGKVARTVVALFKVNKMPTKQEFYDALVPVVGGKQAHKNILSYMKIYLAVASAIANEGDLAKHVKRISKNPDPVRESEES